MEVLIQFDFYFTVLLSMHILLFLVRFFTISLLSNEKEISLDMVVFCFWCTLQTSVKKTDTTSVFFMKILFYASVIAIINKPEIRIRLTKINKTHPACTSV